MKKINIILYVTILFTLLFLEFNCSQFNSYFDNTTKVERNDIINNTFGELKLDIISPDNFRTIYPDFVEISYYTISGTGPDDSTVDISSFTGTSKTLSSLIPGSWAFTVYGWGALDELLVSGTKTINIVIGETVNESIDVYYRQSGSGLLNIFIDWPVDIVIDEVELQINSDETVDIYSNGNSITYSNSTIVSGFYLFRFIFKKEGKTLNSFIEAVHIYDNHDIYASYNLTANDFQKPPISPENLSTASGIGKVTLSWDDTSDIETGFIVERSIFSDSGFSTIGGTDITPLSANTITFEDNTALWETSYYYRVKAINEFGGSNYCQVASGKILDITKLSSLSISEGTLYPNFSSANYQYYVVVDDAASFLTVTPTVEYPSNSTIEVRINGGAYNSVSSGSTSDSLSLATGNNLIEIKITGEDSSYRVYSTNIYYNTILFNYTDSNPYYKITPEIFYAENSRNIKIMDAVGKNVYLVKANFSTSSIDAVNTGDASSDMMIFDNNPVNTDNENSEVLIQDYEPATLFNSNPPDIIKEVYDPDKPDFSISYGELPSYVVDDSTKDFWVQDASSQWIQITATLRAIGEYCYVWIANDNYDNSSSLNNDNKITTAQVDDLKLKFDGTSANNYTDGIFKRVTNIFGYEYGGGTGGNGGRDEDQHISILAYDIEYDYNPSTYGGVLGYFWSKDYYTQAQLGTSLKTNYCEMFYIDVHNTDYQPSKMYGTLAHEYQHMIHFNQKKVLYNLSSPTWYNEMCSMVAEDLLKTELNTILYSSHPSSRISQFSSGYYESGVVDWISSNVLKSYASAYLFGAFIARNYGGSQLFNNILTNNLVSTSSVEKAIQDQGYSSLTFNSAFEEYSKSLIYSTIPAGSDIKRFTELTSSLNDMTYNLAEFDINYYGGLTTFTPDQQISLRPYGNSIHTTSSWQDLAGDLLINLSKPIDDNVSFYIMVK